MVVRGVVGRLVATGALFGGMLGGCGGDSGDSGDSTPPPNMTAAGSGAPSPRQGARELRAWVGTRAWAPRAPGSRASRTPRPTATSPKTSPPRTSRRRRRKSMEMLDPERRLDGAHDHLPDDVLGVRRRAHVPGAGPRRRRDGRARGLARDSLPARSPSIPTRTAGGVMITVQRAVDQITIAASAGTIGGTAPLFITSGDARAVGDRRGALRQRRRVQPAR